MAINAIVDPLAPQIATDYRIGIGENCPHTPPNNYPDTPKQKGGRQAAPTDSG
jgi:hypothetical protein